MTKARDWNAIILKGRLINNVDLLQIFTGWKLQKNKPTVGTRTITKTTPTTK